MGIYLGSTNVGGGGVQPTGSVTTTFTIGQSIMDEITSPMNCVVHGNALLDNSGVISISKIGGIGCYFNTTSGASWAQWGGVTLLTNFNVIPTIINDITYYGITNTSSYSALYLSVVRFSSATDRKFLGGTLKTIKIVSGVIVTDNITISEKQMSIGQNNYAALCIPLANGETLLYAEFTSNTPNT